MDKSWTTRRFSKEIDVDPLNLFEGAGLDTSFLPGKYKTQTNREGRLILLIFQNNSNITSQTYGNICAILFVLMPVFLTNTTCSIFGFSNRADMLQRNRFLTYSRHTSFYTFPPARRLGSTYKTGQLCTWFICSVAAARQTTRN